MNTYNNEAALTASYPAVAAPLSLAVCERPRNRAKAFGVGALSDVELLALVLQGSGEAPESAVTMARALLVRFESLPAILCQPADKLAEVGVSAPLAWRLASLLEVARRVVACREENPVLSKPEAIAAFMASRCLGLEVEKVWVLCLNRKNRVTRCVELTSGTATACLMHPREVLRTAMLENATAFAVVHNHPSGDPAPSAPDLQVTRMVREAARAVDVAFVDHVIVGRAGADPSGRGYFSFREAGML